VARVQLPAMAEYFKGFFLVQTPLNDTTQPVDIKEEGLFPTTDRKCQNNTPKLPPVGRRWTVPIEKISGN